MLSELHVRDLALVEDVWLELGAGLTVLTGETGAGKTVLVGALKLLLGERADSEMVRHGSAEAVVEGRFVLDGTERLVRRRLSAEGRSRCTVDGEMATVGMLGELLGSQVDLHGQHEHQALLVPARHAAYLDRFIGTPAAEALDLYRSALADARAARQEVERIESALGDRDRRIDYLRFQIDDIDAVSPRPEEDDELEARLPRLRHGERLAEAAIMARTALREEGGASDALTRAMTAARAAQALDPALDALIERLEALDVEVAEVAASFREYAEGVEHDPAALDETERRLQRLSDLKRKYGPALGDVLASRAAAERELGMLDEGEAGLERARTALTASREALGAAAERLRSVRGAAVSRFVEALADAAADLALAGARFDVVMAPLADDAWNAEGPDRVEFLFSAASGEPPRPLARIASGGEVSRVMLALKSVLGTADAVPVLVFDEVDAGIGGATALAVGRRLARLAADHQVLVVTHLAQVAAYADEHIVVSKGTSDGRTVTTAHRVAGEGRVAELARMLSGGSSEAGLAHAAELLEAAAGERRG